MLKIGITGGIGSGKTTVCKVFETLGIPVFYADVVAKEIMATNKVLISGIQQAFGKESYLSSGMLNNKHIAKIVFNNQEALNTLNELVHPAVFEAFNKWANDVDQNIPYTMKEAALLFESNSYQMCDATILVTAPLQIKIERIMKRDNVTYEQVISRMSKQLPDEEKIKMADYFINNVEQQSIILQVLHLHQQFLNLKH